MTKRRVVIGRIIRVSNDTRLRAGKLVTTRSIQLRKQLNREVGGVSHRTRKNCLVTCHLIGPCGHKYAAHPTTCPDEPARRNLDLFRGLEDQVGTT